MSWFRPLPRSFTRPLAVGMLVAWAGVMAALVHQSYFQSSAVLAADLARYGSEAQWRGVYYRGAKVGFTVSQTVPVDDGFEIQEDGQLEMTLLGATSAARIQTVARVDRDFALRAFEFSLDPGTGAVEVRGTVDGTRLALEITTTAGTRTDTLILDAPPALALNLGRRLATGLLEPGARYEWSVFDPATLRNAPMIVEVGKREMVRAGDRRIPAFRVSLESAGLRTTSWVTDTGEIVREESPVGLMTVREPAEIATAMAISGRTREDLIAVSAVVPTLENQRHQIFDPLDVVRLRLRLTGADLSGFALDGVGQTLEGDVVEIHDPEALVPGTAEPGLDRYLAPEPLLESDAPEILAETARALGNVTGTRARAETLVRYVNGLLDKKPTVSLPSAREVLRTRVGDCNEHTALYVAMARAGGIPARIAVGLVWVRGAFYYHAWPEVWIDDGPDRGHWLPVDPTLNQFPADATHLRFARGGLDRQAAILPLIGRLEISVLDLEVTPDSERITVGAS
jgi:hypothetical protein